MTARAFRHRLLAIVATGLLAAGGAVAAPDSSAKVDDRLTQKVTYLGGYKRLHALTEELAAASQVKLKCGRTVDDWRVRDIPVVVFARDMPLGKLLKALAVCSHTQFTGMAVAGDDPPAYKLSRDQKTENDIYGRPDAMTEANRKHAAWAWDALVAFANMSDGPLELPKADRPFSALTTVQDVKTLAKALVLFGPDVRQKVLSGETVVVRTRDSLQPAALKQLHLCACVLTQGLMQGGEKSRPPNEEEIEKSRAIIIPSFTPGSADFGDSVFDLLISPVPYDNVFITARLDPIAEANRLATIKGLKLPPRPNLDILDPEDAFPLQGFKALTSPDDWKLPLLQQKVKIKLPEETKLPKRADVLKIVAEQAGLSIICEDFRSQTLGQWGAAKSDFGPEATVAEILRSLDLRPDKDRGIQWFVNEDQKSLVGWSVKWRDRHNNLVPENLCSRTGAKLNGAGAELEDITPLLALTRDQWAEWVSSSLFLWGEDTVLYEEPGFWLLYASLSPKDRELANSVGLPLAKLDTVSICRLLKANRRKYNPSTQIMELPDKISEVEFLSDPEKLSTLVMRVTSKPMDCWDYNGIDSAGESRYGRMCRTFGYKPKGLEKHSYTITLEGEGDGEKLSFKSEMRLPFPVFTPMRELELNSPVFADESGKTK